jgi:hypothetical protein
MSRVELKITRVQYPSILWLSDFWEALHSSIRGESGKKGRS